MKMTTDPDGESLSAQKTHKTLRGKTMLLVGTGPRSKEFVLKNMKSLGLRLVVLETCAEEWAIPYVDEWVMIGKDDPEKIIFQKIRTAFDTMVQKPEGAITFWEEEVPLLARICDEFAFVGNRPQVALNTRSKFAMHELFAKYGCHAAKQHLIRNERDLEVAIEKVGFPAVLKPLYGSDSLYVVFVKNPDDARKQYAYVSSNYLHHPDERIFKVECRAFVYQEFIKGPEFSVECYVQDGKPCAVAVNQKLTMNLPFFMEIGDFCPPKISEVDVQVLTEEAKASVVALGVQNSLAHVEIKLTPEGPQVIEVASRMGGAYIFENVRQVYGFNMIKAGCEIALGIPVQYIPKIPKQSVFAQFLIPAVSGIITGMRGVSELSNDSRVIEHFIWKREGDIIEIPPHGFESVGWILVGASNHQEAERIMSSIQRSISINISPSAMPSRMKEGSKKFEFVPAFT